MLFGTAGPLSTAFENGTSALMQDLWVTFARNPYSGLAMQGWVPYVPHGFAVDFGEYGFLVQNIGIDALEVPCAFGTMPT